jgi:hypothetical protein
MRKWTTMQLVVRRLAVVAVLALVGGIALSGCRSEPSVAAYVGDRKITVDQVNSIVDGVNKINEGRDPAERLRMSRQMVLSFMIYSDLAQRLLDEKGRPAKSGDVELVGRSFGLPVDNAYVQLVGAYLNRVAALEDTPKAAPPTREQVLRYYHAGVDAQLFRPGVRDDEVVAKLTGVQTIAVDLAIQASLDDLGKRQHLKVNPRYAPLSMPLLMGDQDNPVLTRLPFASSGDPFVTDAG